MADVGLDGGQEMAESETAGSFNAWEFTRNQSHYRFRPFQPSSGAKTGAKTEKKAEKRLKRPKRPKPVV